MGISFKDVAKAAVATAALGAAQKVLSGASPAAGIQSAVNKATGALNSIGQNLNNAVNGKLGLPGVPNISGFSPGEASSGNTTNVIYPNIGDEDGVVMPIGPPFPNELHDYASYNCIWTMSGLSRAHINFPDDSYRKGILGPIIFKAGSGNPDDRISLSQYTSPANPSGKYDFFMENVRITGMTGLDKNTGNTNSTGLSFTVVEPYSIGLFFQSLQVCAAQLNYKNWVEMPVLLKLEFIGHENPTFQNWKSIRTKYFPIKIMQMQMKVTDRGSTYDCTAIPWNERAYSKATSSIKNDITCTGRTVQEMLQKGPKSFQSVVNDALAAQAIAASQGKEPIIPDRVLILFPKDTKSGTGEPQSDDSSNPTGATTNSNKGTNNQNDRGVAERLGVELEGINFIQNSNVSPIGLADMGFIDQRKTEAAFGKDNAVWDADKKVFVRGDITISNKEGQATFKQGTSIPNVINQVILSSDYGRQALLPENFDEKGFVNWWRIDTQMYMLDGESNMTQTGKYPYLTVYRVIPHKVHHSRFIQTDQEAKSGEIKKTAIKRYDYIYTSKNLDILDFQINFNAGFYTSLAADSGRFNKDIVNRSQQASDSTGSKPIVENGKLSNMRVDSNGNKYDASSEYASGKHGNAKVGDTVQQLVQIRNDELDIGANQGGANGSDPGTIAARQFHKAINSQADMVQLTMKILGDPFYLGDSGLGNYTAQASNVDGVTADWAINYQRGEVYIDINFKNPIDINYRSGYYDFPSGDEVPIFSGLYRVFKVESTFDKGVFTQTLDLLRMPGQTKEGGPKGKPNTAGYDMINEFVPGEDIVGIPYDDEDAGEWT